MTRGYRVRVRLGYKVRLGLERVTGFLKGLQ